MAVYGQGLPGVLKQQYVFIEGGGQGGFGSLQYERRVAQTAIGGIALAAGLGFGKFVDFNQRFNPDVRIPFSVNVLVPLKGRLNQESSIHNAQLGIGHTYANSVLFDPGEATPTRSGSFNFSLIAAYRLEIKNRLLLRLSYTPQLERFNVFRHWAAFGIGLKLNGAR